MDPQLRQLLEAAARPYREAGRSAWGFARGKLLRDPVFPALLRQGLLPERGNLLDVGCGRGTLLSLLSAAREQHAAGQWPRDWPAPPARLALRGVDSHAARVSLARRALGGRAQIELSDLGDFEFGPCSAIVMIDVLLYLGEALQERVIEKAVAALEPGGLLLLREADAGAGFAYRMTQWSARFEAALRGRFAQSLRCRSAADWTAALASRGLAVDAQPMSRGTPFANVLFVARKVV
ncbi:MAG TPA: methyltransferase domain-containing protein [Burkholderiales bacterium]